MKILLSLLFFTLSNIALADWCSAPYNCPAAQGLTPQAAADAVARSYSNSFGFPCTATIRIPQPGSPNYPYYQWEALIDCTLPSSTNTYGPYPEWQQ